MTPQNDPNQKIELLPTQRKRGRSAPKILPTQKKTSVTLLPTQRKPYVLAQKIKYAVAGLAVFFGLIGGAEVWMNKDAIKSYLQRPSIRKQAERDFFAAEDFFNQRKYQDAEIAYNKVVLLVPDYSGIYPVLEKRLADICIKEKKFDSALSHLEKVVAQDFTNPEPRLSMGSILENARKTQEASYVYVRLLKEVDSKNSKALWRLGRIFKEKNDYSLAEKYLTRLVALEPYNFSAQKFLGETYLNIGKEDLAEKHLKLSFDIKQNDFDVNKKLGELIAKKGRVSEAMKYLKKAADIQPGDYQTNELLGSLYFSQANWDLAEKYLSWAVKLNKDGIEAKVNLAKIYMLKASDNLIKNHAFESESYCKKAVEIDSSQKIAANKIYLTLAERFYNDGEIFLNANKSAEAKNCFEHAKRLGTNNPLVYICSGWLDHLQGNDSLALEQAETALSIGPSNIDTFVKLGWLFEHCGNYSKALQVYEQAQTSFPDSEQLSEQVARVQSKM